MPFEHYTPPLSGGRADEVATLPLLPLPVTRGRGDWVDSPWQDTNVPAMVSSPISYPTGDCREFEEELPAILEFAAPPMRGRKLKKYPTQLAPICHTIVIYCNACDPRQLCD